MISALVPAKYLAPNYGTWVLIVAAAAGFIFTVIEYFLPHGAIAQSWGALLVLVSTALMVGAALVVTIAAVPRGLLTLLEVLLILDILGTGFAAYFLEAYLLLALMVIALIGWAALFTAFRGQIRELKG